MQNPIFLLITILVSYLVGGALGAKPLYDDFIAHADLRRGGNARSDRGNRWQAAVKKAILAEENNLKV